MVGVRDGLRERANLVVTPLSGVRTIYEFGDVINFSDRDICCIALDFKTIYVSKDLNGCSFFGADEQSS
jgi:hypothetical protein